MNPILAGIGLASNLFGAFGAASRQQELERQRQQLLTQLSAQQDQNYQDLRTNNLQSLKASTGQLGDSLRINGSNLGASMANAGVYNSSATAGALTNNANANAAALASLSAKDFQGEQNLLNSNQQNITNDQLGFINQDLGIARNNASSGFGALGGSIADLVGSLSSRNNGPMMNGNQGSTPLQMGDTSIGGGLPISGGYDGGIGNPGNFTIPGVPSFAGNTSRGVLGGTGVNPAALSGLNTSGGVLGGNNYGINSGSALTGSMSLQDMFNAKRLQLGSLLGGGR